MQLAAFNDGLHMESYFKLHLLSQGAIFGWLVGVFYNERMNQCQGTRMTHEVKTQRAATSLSATERQ